MTTISEVVYNSDDDEDYVPENDVDDDGERVKLKRQVTIGAKVVSSDDEEEIMQQVLQEASENTTSKVQEIDDLFNSLDDDPVMPKKKKQRTTSTTPGSSKAKSKTKKSKSKKAKVVNWWEIEKKPKRPVRAKPILEAKEEMVEIKEVKKFAGEQIAVSKLVSKVSKVAKKDNIEKLLDVLNGGKSITTYDKSRMDWEVSKKEEGDAKDLQQFANSKDSFVDKQGFLQATDMRQFELQRKARERQRYKDAKAGKR